MKKVFLIGSVALAAIVLSTTGNTSSTYNVSSGEGYISQYMAQDTTPGKDTSKKKKKDDSTYQQSPYQQQR